MNELLKQYEVFINSKNLFNKFFCNNSFTIKAYSSQMISHSQHQNLECVQCGEHKCVQCGMHLGADLDIDAHLMNCQPLTSQESSLKKYDFSHWAED
jgi:hypothetical protein